MTNKRTGNSKSKKQQQLQSKYRDPSPSASLRVRMTTCDEEMAGTFEFVPAIFLLMSFEMG
jgi:hypothetical protein